jgi:hypothetical protein
LLLAEESLFTALNVAASSVASASAVTPACPLHLITFTQRIALLLPVLEFAFAALYTPPAALHAFAPSALSWLASAVITRLPTDLFHQKLESVASASAASNFPTSLSAEQKADVVCCKLLELQAVVWTMIQGASNKTTTSSSSSASSSASSSKSDGGKAQADSKQQPKPSAAINAVDRRHLILTSASHHFITAEHCLSVLSRCAQALIEYNSARRTASAANKVPPLLSVQGLD